MMKAALRCGALLVPLVVASACADSVTPTTPTTPSGPAGADFPAVSRPARIYLFASKLSYPVSEWTSASRYVLYDDSTFAVQSLRSQGSFEYLGTYTVANTLITFRWDANQNVPAPWRPATGTLTADSLTVRYDAIMNMDGFEDAVYIRTH
jgi:hypothetical protein